MLTERTTTLFVSIFYFQKCQTRDIILYRKNVAVASGSWFVARGSWWAGLLSPAFACHGRCDGGAD